MNTELIPRQTIAMMAEAYQTAKAEIEQAYTLLDQARARLRLSFNQDGYRFNFDIGMHSKPYDKPEALLKEVTREAWATLIDRLELKKLASIQRREEIEKQIESGEGMPEITEANLIAMLENAWLQVPQMIQQCITEVFDWLRPHNNAHSTWYSEYKTNEKSRFELGRKIIKEWMTENWHGQNFHVIYNKEQRLIALDNTFHMLDGKGVIKGHQGPLIEAINACPKSVGVGETAYFRFKCYKNGNLHIEFKRMDLVQKINQIAGGMAIKDAMPVQQGKAKNESQTMQPLSLR